MNDRDKNVLLKLKEEAVVLQELTDGYNLQGLVKQLKGKIEIK